MPIIRHRYFIDGAIRPTPQQAHGRLTPTLWTAFFCFVRRRAHSTTLLALRPKKFFSASLQKFFRSTIVKAWFFEYARRTQKTKNQFFSLSFL